MDSDDYDFFLNISMAKGEYKDTHDMLGEAMRKAKGGR